jgi:hypothetical protein
MDPDALLGMAFTLILAVLVGGFILLFPIARRLGALLESRIEAQKRPLPQSTEDVRALTEAVHALQAEVRLLTERQEFTEQLLTRREQDQLPASAPARLPERS